MDITRAMELRLKGWSYSRIGTELGVTRQRIQQVTSPPPGIKYRVLVAAEGKCQDCGLELGTGGHVHHVSSQLESPDLYNDLPNLRLLCQSCHRKTHAPTVEWKPGYSPNEIPPGKGKLRKCWQCGTLFRGDARTKWCSSSCKNKAWREANPAYRARRKSQRKD